MKLQDILESIGDALVWSFETFLEPAGNIPNNLFIILGFVGFGVWMKMQADYNRKAEQEGGLK